MKIFKTRIPSKLLKIIKKNSQLEPGEGNGNPLQCSCLENPRDRGAWWAAVYGVAQSRTRLKRLSMHACIGKGNGNPLQCSCLENPRDRGAWWAADYGVAQSQTRLKRLSSSGSSTIGKRVVEDFYFLDQHVNSSEVITQARKKGKKNTKKPEIDRSS